MSGILHRGSGKVYREHTYGRGQPVVDRAQLEGPARQRAIDLHKILRRRRARREDIIIYYYNIYS